MSSEVPDDGCPSVRIHSWLELQLHPREKICDFSVNYQVLYCTVLTGSMNVTLSHSNSPLHSLGLIYCEGARVYMRVRAGIWETELIGVIKRFLANHINYDLSLRKYGAQVNIPVIAGIGRAHLDNHEPHIFDILKILVDNQPNSILIDVGANIGQTLLKFATLGGKDCNYVGFEPNIDAACYVEKLIEKNGFKNSIIIPAALGKTSRFAELLVSSRISVDPGASLNPDIRDPSFYRSKKYVQVLNGDEILKALDLQREKMIIKIDVEGFEVEVVEGLRRTLEESRPIIIMEILSWGGFSAEVEAYRIRRSSEIASLMASQNYEQKRIGTSDDYLFFPKEHPKFYAANDSSR